MLFFDHVEEQFLCLDEEKILESAGVLKDLLSDIYFVAFVVYSTVQLMR